MGLKEILAAKQATAKAAAEATLTPAASATATNGAPSVKEAGPSIPDVAATDATQQPAENKQESFPKVAQTLAAPSSTTSNSLSEPKSNASTFLSRLSKTSSSDTPKETPAGGTQSESPTSSGSIQTGSQPSKPLSFAEKMALAKSGGKEQTGSSNSSVQPSTPSKVVSQPSIVESSESTSLASAPQADFSTQPQQVSPLAALADDEQTDSPVANPVTSLLSQAAWTLQDISTEHISEDVTEDVKTAYVDLALKIRNLNAASEVGDIKSEMTKLKKALYENPQAAGLFLPQEIGAMVVALRAMVGETIVEKTAEKKPGRKAKDKPLSAKQLEEGWDEL